MGDISISNQFLMKQNHLYFSADQSTSGKDVILPQPQGSKTYELLSAVLWYGYHSLGIFYKVERNCPENSKTEYTLKELPKFKLKWRTFCTLFWCCILLSQHLWGTTFGDSFLLVSLIRRTMIVIIVFYIFALLYSLQCKKHILIKILKQGDLLEKQFALIGAPVPFTLTQVRFLARFITVGFFLFCVLHRTLNVLKYDYKQDWYEQPAQGVLRVISLNFLLFPSDCIQRESPYYLYEIMGVLGVLLELFAFNIWYFGEALILYLTAIMWQAYASIRSAFKKEAEDDPYKSRKSLDKLMEIHFQATRMMDLINDLTSPVTLFSIAFVLFYMGYWLNFTILEHKFRPHHFALFIFITKSVVTILLQADVHHKAHDVCDYIVRYNKDHLGPINEEMSATVDPAKVFLFASQLYGRHDIGFKGYFFFTITPSFASKVAGLILTYTIVVTQFSLNDAKCPDCPVEYLTNATII